MKYRTEDEKVYDHGFLKIREAWVSHEKYDGEWSAKVNRQSLVRNDAVAVLVLDRDRQALVLTEQFRYGTTFKDGGWLVEIAAGGIEPGEGPLDALAREMMEELGYALKDPEFIAKFYVSPGMSSERIWLYYAEVTSEDLLGDGGGNAHEHEDIRKVFVPLDEVDSLVSEDAKTIIALQWFKARRIGENK